jgi:hypothetical protein
MAGIRVNFKRLVEIRIRQHYFSDDDFLGHVEGYILLWSPIPPFLVGGKGSKRSEYMRSPDPHVSIVVDDPNEATQFSVVLGSIDG